MSSFDEAIRIANKMQSLLSRQENELGLAEVLWHMDYDIDIANLLKLHDLERKAIEDD